jgi:hypothetical protein
MKTINFENDIKVFYVEAESFPEGIEAAHKKLHELVPFSDKRKFFGISRPENGRIVYRAGVEEVVAGEAERLNCKTMILEKGKYISVTIEDYMKHIEGIGMAFEELLSFPGIDQQGYCVEWYFNDKDVRCMVRLASEEK